jgi:hypothetical protein
MGSHHGSLTPLPQDWKFPSMTWTQLIHNWLLGNEEYNIPHILVRATGKANALGPLIIHARLPWVFLGHHESVDQRETGTIQNLQ